MSTAELWKEIYAAKSTKGTEERSPTFFPTGFDRPTKNALVRKAEEIGCRKTGDVNGSAHFVVTGESPGAGRLKKAEVHGCTVVTDAQFLVFVRHGVVDVTDEEARSILT